MTTKGPDRISVQDLTVSRLLGSALDLQSPNTTDELASRLENLKRLFGQFNTMSLEARPDRIDAQIREAIQDFETKPLLEDSKILLRNLVQETSNYLESYDKTNLLQALQIVVVNLNAKQGYFFNYSEAQQLSAEIYHKLLPIQKILMNNMPPPKPKKTMPDAQIIPFQPPSPPPLPSRSSPQTLAHSPAPLPHSQDKQEDRFAAELQRLSVRSDDEKFKQLEEISELDRVREKMWSEAAKERCNGSLHLQACRRALKKTGAMLVDGEFINPEKKKKNSP